MTKKNLLWVSGIIGGTFLLTDWIGTYKLCGKYATGNCPFLLHNIFILFFPFLFVFILSLITYKMRDEIFRVWLKFAYIWIPLTLILTILAPEYDPSLLPVTKGVVSFFMSILFLIISLLIILIKYLSLRKKEIKN